MWWWGRVKGEDTFSTHFEEGRGTITLKGFKLVLSEELTLLCYNPRPAQTCTLDFSPKHLPCSFLWTPACEQRPLLPSLWCLLLVGGWVGLCVSVCVSSVCVCVCVCRPGRRKTLSNLFSQFCILTHFGVDLHHSLSQVSEESSFKQIGNHLGEGACRQRGWAHTRTVATNQNQRKTPQKHQTRFQNYLPMASLCRIIKLGYF